MAPAALGGAAWKCSLKRKAGYGAKARLEVDEGARERQIGTAALC